MQLSRCQDPSVSFLNPIDLVLHYSTVYNFLNTPQLNTSTTVTMGGKTQLQLEKEDKERDAAFNKAMHGKTAAQANSVATILFKNPEAKQAALDAYFKHFDNKKADNETDADRKVGL